jgi:hypothetical protein
MLRVRRWRCTYKVNIEILVLIQVGDGHVVFAQGKVVNFKQHSLEYVTVILTVHGAVDSTVDCHLILAMVASFRSEYL